MQRTGAVGGATSAAGGAPASVAGAGQAGLGKGEQEILFHIRTLQQRLARVRAVKSESEAGSGATGDGDGALEGRVLLVCRTLPVSVAKKEDGPLPCPAYAKTL